MGKIARFACIFTPMLCTLFSLICVILVMIGGTNKNNGTLSNLYFFKLDTRYATHPELSPSIDIPFTDLDNKLLDDGLKTASADLGISDFYTANLWGYCQGTYSTFGTAEVWTTTQCSKPKVMYWFNVIEILGLESDNSSSSSSTQGITEDQIPDHILKINRAIKTASHFMVASYILGGVATALTFFLGWFGLLSRWGSCITTIFANVAFLCLLSGSSIATALYFTLKAGFNKAIKDFGAEAALNKRMLSITWMAVAFAAMAGIFWMLSTCCCSGRSSRIMGREGGNEGKGKGIMKVEKAPYTYERVASPYYGENGSSRSSAVGGGMGMQLNPMTQKKGVSVSEGYEPYRHATGH